MQSIAGRLRSAFPPGWIRFDRMELAGAFGDIGTDLPLLVGVILTARMDTASVLIGFGLMQILSALIYGIPMPVQPLKAVAALVIAGGISAPVVLGGGLAIGACMLLLTVTGAIDWLVRVIPAEVIRGIQFGLGLKLASIALGNYVASDGWAGYTLAAVCLGIVLLMRNVRRFPAALVVVGIGIIYALIFKSGALDGLRPFGFALPQLHTPAPSDIWQGFILLALAQIPLSLGNSILATQSLAHDYFPERKVGVRKIGFTYSLMNIALPFASGMPCCHGSGGLAGHYAFGARTGGSVLIYGLLYLLSGLFLSGGFAGMIQAFPLPVLGVILLVEALYLMLTLKHVVGIRNGLFIALLVGLIANGLPYGFLVGLLVGTALSYLYRLWPARDAES